MASEWLETPYGEFAADFTGDRLANLCDQEAGIQTGPFGSQLHQEDYVQFGTPIITVEHLGENRILHENTPKVSDADRDRLSRYWLRRGDIVFSRVGSVDRRALVRQGEEGWLFSGRCLRVRPAPKKIDSEYLSYFFGLPAFQEHIRAIAVGATMPSLNTKLLSDIFVPHPSDIGEQRAIGRILGSLDERIDHNRALAANLEAITRRLFKSWFVDFDPVRAKAAGEKPAGLADDIAAQFPDRFVYSELEELPEGWKVGALCDVCELNPETWSTRKHPEILQYIDLSNVKSGCIEEATSYLWDDSPSRARRVLRCGDTILGTVRPGNRSFALIAKDGLTGSTGFAVLRPSHPHHREYLYLAATSDDAIERLAHLADGAAYPAVRPDVVTGAEVVLPNDEIMRQFSVITCPMFDQIALCQSESSVLSSLRDLLLPRLISGKLRVAEAESLIEEVMA